LIHPSDSIDLIEFTFQMEKLLGITLNETDVRPLVDAGVEDMKVRTWVRLVLEIRKRKMAQPSAIPLPRADSSHSEGAH